jgi:hypothetical protein
MTLKSALQDLRETTLAAVTGLLGKLDYLASLRRGPGKYEHWGMETLYGAESAERAMKTAHTEVVSGVLRTPLPALEKDLEESSRAQGVAPQVYIEQMRGRLDDLLPEGKQHSPAADHLSSVLLALSNLKKHRAPATRSASSPRPRPGR